MNKPYSLRIEQNPNPKDTEIVREGLNQYNRAHADSGELTELAIILRDKNGKVIGGLLGGTYWRYLNVDVLWVEEGFRRKGAGSKLLGAAEQEAVRRRCRYAHLNTHDFQAVDFYRRHGYAIVGQLDDLPPGHTRYLMRKSLV